MESFELDELSRRRAAGGTDPPVSPGSVVFVATGFEHRVHDIEEDLAVLVVFAPPES